LKRSPRTALGFFSFIDEANDLLKQVTGADLPTQKRNLHTLKGNAGLMGFSIVASLCHQAEDELAERREPLPAEALAPARTALAHVE